MNHRFYPVNWIQWLTLALAITVASVVPILFIRIDDQSAHNTDALRTVLCLAVSEVNHAKHIPPKSKRKAIRFYERALTDIHARPCPGGTHLK